MQNRNTHRESARYLTTWAGRILWLSLLAAFVLTILPVAVHAQIIGDIEATVPFPFHVGDTKLPAGTYRIHVLDRDDGSVLEISSADGSVSALFDVGSTQANTTPAKTELIFNKYGNHYFLSKMYDEGEASGSEVVKSRYEKRLISAEAETQVVQQHVPAYHPKA